MKRTRWKGVVAITVLGAAVLLAARPFLTGRYVFFLDQTFGPGWNPIPRVAFGFRTVYGGRVLMDAVLAGLAAVFGVGVVQKLLLVGILSLIAIAGYRCLPGGRVGRLYGALLLLVNPFTYARIVAGQYLVVWGLGMLAVLLAWYVSYLDDGGYRSLVATVVALTLLGFSPHLLFGAGILLAALSAFRFAEQRDRAILVRTAFVPTVAVPINAYWIGPLLLSSDPLSAVATANHHTFVPEVDLLSPLLTTASMHGFWRDGVVYALDRHPGVAVVYLVILYLTVRGFLAFHDHPERGFVVKGMAVTGVLALILGTGTSGPLAGGYDWLLEHAPLFAGMRDANKFVAFLVLAYGYLGSLGVTDLFESAAPQRLPHRVPHARSLATWFVLALVVVSPVLYAYPMVTGYAGQVESQSYPDGWYEVKERVDGDASSGSILFLPWHLYMDYSWIEGDQQRVATPARKFFERPVIQGDNVETATTYSTSTNPISHYVEFLFGLGPQYEHKKVTNLGELLSHIDVRYVLLTKEVDWQAYDTLLGNQTDLKLVFENRHFKVYRNQVQVDRAYAVNRVIYVANWQQFLARSRTENTTRAVYVVDPERAGKVIELGPPRRESVAVASRHPASYRLEGNNASLTTFSQRQATYAADWQYDGEPPQYHHLGIASAFESSSTGATVRHAAFHRRYLPSYAVSLFSFVVLLGYGGSRYVGRRDVVHRLTRFRIDRQTDRRSDRDD